MEMTYDVEMAPDGPLNFIANGIVSHNSHAACYALISYRTAWLRANYPAEYMAALISSVMDTKDKVPFFVAQAEQMGIAILPPDVNLSDHEFVVVDGNIRFGLDAVKGVGYRRWRRSSVPGRRTARSPRLFDFCERIDNRAVNKKAIEALIKCGAFGSTGRLAQGHAGRARAGAGRGPEGPAGRADRPGLDLRPGDRGRRGAAPAAGSVRRARATRRSRARSSTAPSCWRPRRSRSACSSPPIRSRRSGAALQGRSDSTLARAVRPPRRRLGDGRRDGHPGQADQDQEGRLDDVRHPLRPRGVGRDHRLRQGAGGQRGRAGDRLDRARPRAGRPQGPREDVRGRPAGGALRAQPGGGGQGAGRGRQAGAAAHARCACASTPRRCRRASSASSRMCWPASRATPTWSSS